METIMKRATNGDWADAQSTVRAVTFGELAKLAIPAMKAYQSDLFHDAKWIADYVNGPMRFFWGFDEAGTDMNDRLAGVSRDNKFCVIISQDERENWYVNIQEV